MKPGHAQPSFDKQFVREYLETLDWDKQPPAPPLPDDVCEATSQRYLEAIALPESLLTAGNGPRAGSLTTRLRDLDRYRRPSRSHLGFHSQDFGQREPRFPAPRTPLTDPA